MNDNIEFDIDIKGYELNKMFGFISLYRSVVNSKYYKDSNTIRLWIHCLIKANWREKEWSPQGIIIKRGEFVTSYDKLKNELGLTKSQIETSLKKLIKNGNIRKEIGKMFTKIIVCNYDTYQIANRDISESISEANKNLIGSSSEANKNLIGSSSEQLNNSNNSNNLNNSNNPNKSEREATHTQNFLNLKERLIQADGDDRFESLFKKLDKEFFIEIGYKNIAEHLTMPTELEYQSYMVYVNNIESDLGKQILSEIDSNEFLGERYKDFLGTFYKFVRTKLDDKKYQERKIEWRKFNDVELLLICFSYNGFDVDKDVFKVLKPFYDEYQHIQRKYYIKRHYDEIISEQQILNAKQQYGDYVYYKSKENKNFEKVKDGLESLLKYRMTNVLGNKIIYIPSDETKEILDKCHLPNLDDKILHCYNELGLAAEKRVEELLKQQDINRQKQLEEEKLEKEKENNIRIVEKNLKHYLGESNETIDVKEYINIHFSSSDFTKQKNFFNKNQKLLEELKKLSIYINEKEKELEESGNDEFSDEHLEMVNNHILLKREIVYTDI